MIVLVPIKRVVDYNVKVRVKADHSGMETDHVKMSINPFDAIAVEEALRLKERSLVDEVVVVSIGTQACEETLRSALAMGADRALLVVTDHPTEPLAVAKALESLVRKHSFELVILGKQAIDDDCNQTAQMLAGRLGWPQATFASKILPEGETLLVTREVDGGLAQVRVGLPAVISTDLRLNEPRYATLPNIVKAKKKPLERFSEEDLGIDMTPRLTILKVTPPPERRAGRRVDSVEELVDVLRNEAKVL